MPSSSPTSSACTTAIRLGGLGYLQSIAFRACRLVVDTGMHAKRWTRQQAVEWFVTTNGSNRARGRRSEVDRYCVWPGQACGYKVGHTEITRLRDQAQRQLGAGYDLAAVRRRRGQGRQRAADRAGAGNRPVRCANAQGCQALGLRARSGAFTRPKAGQSCFRRVPRERVLVKWRAESEEVWRDGHRLTVTLLLIGCNSRPIRPF